MSREAERLREARHLIRGIADLPRIYAKLRPDHPAMIFEGKSTSYETLQRRTNRVAHGLTQAGLRAGSRFAYLGKNTDTFFELYIGGAKSGAVIVAVNWRLGLEEMYYVLQDSESEMLFLSQDFAFIIPELKTRLPKLRTVISLGERFAGAAAFEDWLAGCRDDDPGHPIAPDDVVIQLYTSGTTGQPKGAQLTNRSGLAATRNVDNEWLGVWGPETMSMVSLPVFHIAGSCWGVHAFYSGATNVILREANVELILRTFAALPVTKAGFVPSLMKMILDHPSCRPELFASLKTIYYGASPISPELLRRSMAAFGCGFIQMFGMTESNAVGTILREADHDLDNPGRMLSCGRPPPGVELRIIGPDGGACAVGQPGEILLRGEMIMKGYWKRPEATAEAVRDGWYHTGDVGELDQDGYLFLRDRLKDMIISGGENVYSSEVENAISSHPDVADAAVIGVPDEKWGEAVKAFVVRAPGGSVTAEALIEHVRSRIAHYKAPRSVAFVDALPRNAAGKVLKRVLREPYRRLSP